MDGAKFTMDLTSSGAARLRNSVKEKLSEYIGNYTDDVLVEYVVVLVGHGKEKSQAVKDLEAFLGGDSESFVSWLWDHMSTNKHLYIKTEDDRPSVVASENEDTQAQGEPSLRSVVAVVEHGEGKTTGMELEEKAEGHGTAGTVKEVDKGMQSEDDVNTGVEMERPSMRRGRRRDSSRHNEAKRSRSPEMWTRRGRGRADRPDMKEMSPPVVKASRRLLINAVREVVVESALLATKKDVLKRTESAKRLQSVVSLDADVQNNGGADIEMAHNDTLLGSDSFAVEEPQVTKTAQLQYRKMQGKPASVWDRLALTDRNQQFTQNNFANKEEAIGVQVTRPRVFDGENKGKWKRNVAAGHGVGPGRGRGGKGPKYNGVVRRPSREVEVNGHLLGDALRRVTTDQMRNHEGVYRRNAFRRKLGLHPGNESSQAGGEEGDGVQLNFSGEDVLAMKKRLRQVQLDMTKLRARQAEVTKEVQKAPSVGSRPLPFEPQPSQEDVNSRSIFVSNVHFAATQAALRVHFGRCGNINRVTLLVEAATGKPKGSAYVEFATRDAVENALALNESSLLSRTLKVMRKDDAVAEMITPPALLPSSFPPPTIPRPYLREQIPPRKLYPVRQAIGLFMPHAGASNLKWKRDASAATGTSSVVPPSTNGEISHTGPVRLSRSLSYVRVAPYAKEGTAGAV